MNIKIYLTSIGLCLSCALLYAQCEKDISTNPLNPVNDEFLPLKNNWYPNHPTNPVPYTVNSFLNSNSGMNWSPGTSIQLDLTAGWSYPFGVASSYIIRNPFSDAHEETHLNPTMQHSAVHSGLVVRNLWFMFERGNHYFGSVK